MNKNNDELKSSTRVYHWGLNVAFVVIKAHMALGY